MGEHTNKAMGKAKQAFGRYAGDRDLQREGQVQEATGKVQGGVRKVSHNVQDALDKMAGKMGDRRRAREDEAAAARDR
jgi:uncharacterized protein YjbJ (UPF0337 family)